MKVAGVKFVVAFAYYFYNNFVTNFPAYFIRHFYLRRILRIPIGHNTAIHMGCFFSGRKITIGNNTVINRNCFLDARVGIEIGNNVSISPDSYIISLGHDPQSPEFATKGGIVVLSENVWIGIRATILPGTRLGKGCVVGAAAVVTKSFDDNAIVAGNPAQKIGERTKDLRYNLSYFPFFNTDILPEDR